MLRAQLIFAGLSSAWFVSHLCLGAQKYAAIFVFLRFAFIFVQLPHTRPHRGPSMEESQMHVHNIPQHVKRKWVSFIFVCPVPSRHISPTACPSPPSAGCLLRLLLLPARIHLLIAKRLLLIKNGRQRTAASRQWQMRMRKVERQQRRGSSSGRRNTRRTYRMSILISLHNYVRLQDPASTLSHSRRHFFVRCVSSQ